MRILDRYLFGHKAAATMAIAELNQVFEQCKDAQARALTCIILVLTCQWDEEDEIGWKREVSEMEMPGDGWRLPKDGDEKMRRWR